MDRPNSVRSVTIFKHILLIALAGAGVRRFESRVRCSIELTINTRHFNYYLSTIVLLFDFSISVVVYFLLLHLDQPPVGSWVETKTVFSLLLNSDCGIKRNKSLPLRVCFVCCFG